MFTSLTTLAAVLAQPVAAATPEGARPTAQADGSPRAGAGLRYCIETTATGTRLKRRACYTRKEWLDRGFDPLAPAE